MSKEFKHFTTKNGVNTEEDSNARNEGWGGSWKAYRKQSKMTKVSPSLSVVLLTVKTEIGRVVKNTRSNYMLSTRFTLGPKTQIN